MNEFSLALIKGLQDSLDTDKNETISPLHQLELNIAIQRINSKFNELGQKKFKVFDIVIITEAAGSDNNLDPNSLYVITAIDTTDEAHHPYHVARLGTYIESDDYCYSDWLTEDSLMLASEANKLLYK